MRLKSLRTMGDRRHLMLWCSQARRAPSSCIELVVVLLASADLELTPSLNDLKWTDPVGLCSPRHLGAEGSYLRVHNREIATRSTERAVRSLP